jgi:hypothetical protein
MSNVRQFIKFVKAECEANDIKLKLKRTHYIVASKSIRCSGYFDEVSRELVVARNNPQWLEILVHEFAHLTQWKDNCKEWRNLGDSITKVDDWLAGKRVKYVKKALGRVRDLELDNEKRSTKLIKDWGLPIDIKEYTQKANAYVQFYNWMYFTRRWCSIKNSPTKNPEVYKQMPTIFRMDYKNMSEKYLRIFEEQGV